MLMLSPEAPWPATTGGLVRIAALLNVLADHFDITFVSPRWPGQVIPEDRRIRFICPMLAKAGNLRRAIAALDWRRPFHAAVYAQRAIRDVVRHELVERAFDVVYGHFIYSLEYLDGMGVRVIIDQQNVDRVYWRNRAEHSPFPLNAFAGWNVQRTAAYEDSHLARVWGYVSVTDADRARTREYAAGAVRHFWVAPNGVDTAAFAPAAERTVVPDRVTLGYLGSMDLAMNIDAVQRFARTMLPAIRHASAGMDVRFLVIGRTPSPAIRRLAERTSGMSLSGTVDDVVPWLQKVDILVCPLRMGAGSKLKVAEALSCALPVVGSPLALAGLPGSAGEHYMCATDDCGLTEAVCTLIAEPARRAVLSRKARQLAIDRLDWRVIGQRLAHDIVAELAAC